MTNKLKREDLWSLEEYADRRRAFRDQVMAHKTDRQIAVGPNATLYFEDRMTMQYQVQEMLRIEKIFDRRAIQEELDAYNPLIPDGSNWKVTFMIEYPEVEERQQALARLRGIEERVWVQVESFAKVWAIADEDLERQDAEKTSAVHFLRFELAPDMVQAAKQGVSLAVGVDHENYRHTVAALPEASRASLVQDLS